MKGLGVLLIELDEDNLLRSRDFSGTEQVMQEVFKSNRGFEKSQDILRHDIAHYYLILNERADHALTWFLTRDRSLEIVAARLKGEAQYPFCFSLIGFLQSVSPFLVSGQEEQGIADIFSALVTDQILPREQLFNVRELTLLVEMNHDVISTPKDKLIAAVDYVKSAVLRGQTYRMDNYAEVALGLRSYLASSSEEQISELEKERVRLDAVAKQEAQTAAEERRLRLLTEARILSQVEQIAEFQELSGEQSDEIESLKAKLTTEARAKGRRAMVRAASFSLIGYLLIYFRNGMSILLQVIFPSLKGFDHTPWIVASFGWLLLVVFSASYLRKVTWPDQGRVGLMASLLVFAYGLSGGFGNTSMVSTAALGGLVAGALLLAFTIPRPNKPLRDP
jgi:hypothetical protein